MFPPPPAPSPAARASNGLTSSLIDLSDMMHVPSPAAMAPPMRPAVPPASRTSVASSTRGDCCVCLERPVETALLECGHAVACMQCATALSEQGAGCPCCRRSITRIARIYM
jgi:hypothetical protein